MQITDRFFESCRNFFSKLNKRQLILHFIASWFIIYASHVLASLHDYKFLYTQTPGLGPDLTRQIDYGARSFINLISTLGIVAAYVISWQISLRRNWFWANSVIVFFVAFVLYNFGILGLNKFHEILLLPGQIFGENSVAYVITNGVVLLGVGSFLFFKKQIINYIDRGVKRGKKKSAPAIKPGLSTTKIKK
jgi:hypothetical protein